MRNPHRNAEIIKAWADGYVIQYKAVGDGYWVDILSGSPHWDGEGEYRIKPEPKPDVVSYAVVRGMLLADAGIYHHYPVQQLGPYEQVKITFDGETGKLKSAEVIS